MRKNYAQLLLILFVFIFNNSKSITITSTAAGGNWITGASWVGGVAPVAANDVVIVSSATITMNAAPGVCNHLTINGILTWVTAGRTLNVGGNLIMNNGSTISGTATGNLNVAGTFTAAAGSEVLNRVALTISSTSIINGIVSITNTNGAKVFTGNVTFNNGSGLNYTASATLTFSGSIITNGTVTVSGTTAGLANVNSISVSAASVFNISDWSLTVSGSSTIDGTIKFNNNNGTKTFGAITVSASGTWDCSAVDEQFVNNGNINCNGVFWGSLSNTASTEYAMSVNGLSINGTLTFANLRIAGGTSTTNNASLTITNLLNGGGTFIQGTGGVLNNQIPIGGGGFIVTGFNATTNIPNIVDFNLGGNQDIRNATTYYHCKISNSGVKTFTGNTVIINGDLTIQGNAQLDADAINNYDFILKGNWNNVSANADPFLEQNGGVTLMGNTGTQTITCPFVQETFHHLTINNTSPSVPSVQTSQNILVTNEYDQTAGTLDLAGKNLTITNNSAATTNCDLNGGLIMTSVAGSLVNFSDGALNKLDVIFTGTDVGDATNPIPLTVTAGRCCLDFLELYGIGNFTKQLNIDDVCGGGGCIYHNNVTFTAEVTASRWRFGDNNAQPDTFYGTVNYNANAKGGSNNNFIVGANSLGNVYWGPVTFLSTTIGGFYIGRQNGSGNSSFTFHAPIVITVNDSGNVVLGNTGPSNLSTIDVESTIQINSNLTSIGDVYIGNNIYTTLNMIANAQIIDGTIQGATNIYFNNVIQTNSLTNTITSTAASNSTIYIGTGNGTNGPCIFGGVVNFTSPNISLRGSTFNNNNNFQSNGTAGFASWGGNTFNGGVSYFNNGAGYWRLANNASDDYNGNVTLRQSITAGLLDPTYNAACTFAGNINTTPTAVSINFATGVNGRVIFDGTINQFIIGTAALKPIIKRLTMANSGGGSLTLNVPVSIATSGDVAMNSGKIFTTATNILKLVDESITINIGNISSFIDGPLYYAMARSGTNTLNLPLGKSSDWRPAVLTLTHNSATSYSYTAEVFNASAYGLGYTIPVTLDTVSFVHYWTIDRTLTSTGVASNANLTAASIQLYYDTNDGVFSASNLRVAKTIGAGAVWFDMGGTGTANNTGSITSTVNFTSFSTFTLAAALGGVWNPLPIELISFTANACNNKICLDWSTASEINNDFFTIEKTKDGIYFEQAAIVDGAGNSTITINYSTIDNIPYEGESFYRLVQTDFDGKFTFSSLQKVEFANSISSSFNVLQNPSNGESINISFDDLEGTEILVVVYNGVGQEFYSKILVNSVSGNNVYAIDPEKRLASGAYFISATSKNQVFNKKLIIRN